MARFNIYSSDGQIVRYSGAPKYNGIFGKPSYIEFAEIASPTPIAWTVGDYVDYTRTGFRYRLYSEPQVVKSATSTQAGDAFVYKNVQFFARTKDLEIALFRDVVLYDNSVHFSSLAAVDTYEDVYGIARRIQANMDAFAPNAWNIQVVTTTDTDLLAVLQEVKQFSVSDGTCLDALNAIYNTWSGIGWVYSVVGGVNTITIGRPNIQDSGNTVSEFSYGRGNGLKVLTRNLSSKSEMATRIYAYGSDRNMPTRYYNNYTPAIKDHESVYIPHLMLPLTDWGSTGGQKDARLAYLEDATAISKYGLIPKVLRFDGSGDNEEIYPSVTGMTIGDVTDSTYPSTGYSTSERIDVLKAVTNPDDDGQYTEGGEKVKYSIDLTHSALSTSVTTKSKQEYVTLGASTPLASSGSTSLPAGKYVIKMDAVHGTVSDANDYLASVPKAYMEVYVGSDLKASVSKDVIVPRMDDEFYVDFGDVTFTADTGGVLKIYWRIEISLTPVSSAVTISYAVPAATIPVSVEYSIGDTFTVKLKQIGFDINDMGGVLSDGLCTLSMRSGMCAGRDFVVTKCEYNSTNNDWVLTCRRQNDTSLMLYFPNSTYPLAAGDQFVLVDLQMPDKYVTAAMTRLHEAASKALARLSKPLRVYTPEIDSKEVLLSEVTLLEGLYMPVYDTDLISATGNTEWVLIDSVTIAENESPIPVWGATLRDEKPESMLQIITGELNDTNKRLRDMEVDDSRAAVIPVEETGVDDGLVGVVIEAESTIFPPSSTAQTITLTAKTSGLNSPTYQWYYYGLSDWVALSGETHQAYIVDSESQIYFQGGDVVEDFKVVVTDGITGGTYSDSVQITKLTSGGITIALSNPAHLFAGTADTAVNNQSDSTGVVAYDGTTRIVATVNSISGEVTGLTASVRANTNGTTAPIIDIAVTNALVTASGALTINVTAGSVTRDLTYSWAVAFKGEKGDSTATINLYKRTTGDPSSSAPGNMTYSFSDNTLSPSSALNGWLVEMPDDPDDGPCYVTSVTVNGTTSVNITGGWVSNGGDWSDPSRLTGDNGLMGKVMRGINEYSQYGLGTQGSPVNYWGLRDSDTSHVFYDMVYREVSGTRHYYYCQNEKKGNLYAREITPGTESDSDTKVRCWIEATNFDFIATKVLMATNAFIDIFSGNAAYMYNNNQTNIVAGMQGGSTVTYNGQTVNQINFFAGGSDPQQAPFRVDYLGNVFMTSGNVGPFTLMQWGLKAEYEQTVQGHQETHETHYGIDGFSYEYTALGETYQVSLNAVSGLDIQTTKSQWVSGIHLSDGSGDYVNIYAHDIQRNGESVITSYDGNILKIRKMTQSAYNALSTKDAYTLYVIKD